MCEDYNAGLGNLLDTDSEEALPDRVVTDSTVNTVVLNLWTYSS